jgi:uncharacterized protein (TIGR00730 family)
MLRRLCVFCGSNTGARPAYAEAARQVGALLAEEDIGLVYGGGNIGLMGLVADTILQQGGEVVGVIPGFLKDMEVAHLGLTELRVVASMHERKALMADLADAFLALPGGFGTFDEFCEILTWAQLRLQPKPCGLLNVEGYYDHLLAQFDHSVREGFLKPQHRALLISDADPSRLLAAMRSAKPAPASADKWIARDPR